MRLVFEDAICDEQGLALGLHGSCNYLHALAIGEFRVVQFPLRQKWMMTVITLQNLSP